MFEFCVLDVDECEFDGDCYFGKKCCSNMCFIRCFDFVGFLGLNVSGIGVIVVEGRVDVVISWIFFLGGSFKISWYKVVVISVWRFFLLLFLYII